MSRFNKHIIHTTSPIVDLKIVKTNKNKLFTIGWICEFGGEHKDSLIEIVFPAIKEFAFPAKLIIVGVQKFDDIEFINHFFRDNSNIEIEIPLDIDWNDETNIQNRIVLFDVGIATSTNSEMQLSKSGIKAKQYMNNGVPVLSTDLPKNNSVVIDGVNGCFCTTKNDFKEKFIQLKFMTDTDYSRLIENARRSISNFDHNKYFADFEKIKNGT